MREPVLSAAATGDKGGAPPPEPVPQTRSHREMLLRTVQSYIERANPVPPLSFEELRFHTDHIVRAAGENGYRDFVAVLLNNAVWRDSLARVPYDRRLLLLPQCLRYQNRCAATVDEFGLVCNHCGLCSIHSLQTEAERLGYVVLVAEGTTIASTLIQAGKIDGIVGVSCLSSLERVFPLMEAAAIPGIAIPLLQNGCANTKVDLDWVWDSVFLIHNDRTRRMDLDALRAEVDFWFTPESLEAILGPAAGQTERIARAWLTKSGKRWRPFLAACAFQALQEDMGTPLPENLRKVAVAVECFHKASLVHDDIEDNDAVRYGQKTVHEEYGIPIAINVGDFLLGEGYRMIAECGASPERTAAMLWAAAAGHRHLCVGQGEELCWMRAPRPLSSYEVLDIFRQKTAPAFEVALRLGALYAGANHEVGDVLHRYSEALGVAYQIRDDLEDFGAGAQPDEAEPIEPSLLLAIAWQRARGDARVLLEALWRRSQAGEINAALEPLMQELNVEDAARRLLESYQEEAIRSLRPLENANLKGLLRRVIGAIFRDGKQGT